MSTDNKMRFFEIFSIDKNLPDIQLFKDAAVTEMSIDKTRGIINVEVALEQLCTEKAGRTAEKLIKEKYQANGVFLTPRYPEALINDEYFEILKTKLTAEFPAVSGILSGSEWSYGDKTITVTLRNGDAKFFTSCIDYIKSTIRSEFALSVSVETKSKHLSESETELEIIELHKKNKSNNPEIPQPKPKPITDKKPEKPRIYNKTAKIDGELVLGKPNFSEFTRINELCDGLGKVSAEGDIFAVSHKELPHRDLVILNIDITDYAGSIRVTKPLKTAEAEPVIKKLKPGVHICVHGVCVFDTYARDNVLRAVNIVIREKKIRKDTAPVKRVELHMHTNMSAMDGVTNIKDLAERAAYWGHKALAVTDHGVAQAFPDAMDAAKKHGIKMIYGVEAYYLNNANTGIVSNGANEALDGEFICFDIETTGLNPRQDGITEIAAVVLRNRELCEEFHTYVNPKQPIPPKITELTGISNETVMDADTIDKALPKFLEFVNGRCLVAHNAEFDMGFIREACNRLGYSLEFKYMDSLALSRAMLPELKSHKLNSVASELDLPKFTHHHATDDAKTVAYMLRSFFETLSPDIKSINELNSYNSKESLKGLLKNRPYHMLILVKNQVGLKNLYKLISYSHLNYFYKRPIIPKSVLLEHREGLILGSACEAGELYSAVMRGAKESELRDIAKFYDFLEIQPLQNNAFMVENGMVDSFDTIKEFNLTIMKLADSLKIPLVATGDVHFLDAHDELYRRVLMTGMGFSDADRQAPLYYKTTDEMLKEFSYLGEDACFRAVVENPNKIADMCDEVKPIPDGQYPPTIAGSKDELDRLCKKRAHELYGDPLPDIVRERMEYELSKIIGHDFDVMYIIAQKLVSKSIEDGYLVGSRGSVGSSFAAYLAGITEVNALQPHYRCPCCKSSIFPEDSEHAVGADLPERVCECGTQYCKDGFDIPFQTFLGFDGDKTPDIDLNFSGEYQARAHRQTIEIFGEGHVFRAGTIGTIKDKTAYGFVSKYVEQKNYTMSRAELNRITAGCTGIKRTTGQHPGGVMIVPKDREIYDFTPVQHPADKSESDIITTHFDYHSIHDNLLKLDLLGHDDPTMIKMLEELTGISATDIPLDDAETMSLFTSTHALGIKNDPILGKTGSAAIPEFGTKFVRDMLCDTEPTTFDELIRISGLSHGTDVWINNAQDLIKKKTANLKQIICARDDIMLYLISRGIDRKLSFYIMESVRKGKGLKPDWEDTMRAHEIPEWYLESCKKIKYMFPKAHAVAYVMMAFRIAWFKVHEPRAFYAAYFSIRARAFDASVMTIGDDAVVAKINELSAREKLSEVEKDMMVTLEVCHEFYLRGFKFDRIDLYKSSATEFLITDNGLLPPFTSIPGLGEVAARSIATQRETEEFFSIEEMQFRCEKVSKAVIELLEKNRVLDKIPKSSQISLF